jgi:hypothetical protein
MERDPPRVPFGWIECRDISEYRTAFSECRPQSRPESRPWLEAHLTAEGPARPSSHPTASLFHWGESSAPRGETRKTALADDFEEDLGSPYISGFRHSQSLDFDKLDQLEPF